MKRIAAYAAVLLLAGCGPDNPFRADPDVSWQGGDRHPHIAWFGTESSGPGSTQLNDLDPETPGIQDAVILQFSEAMDPGAFLASAFLMEETYPGSRVIAFENIAYHPETQRAVLAGTFSEDAGYLLTVQAGTLVNLAGMELDPNRNAMFDGSPWDDARFVFASGAGITRDITPPRPAAFGPVGGGVEDLLPGVFVAFDEGPMDVSLLNTGTFTLVRTSDSSAVPLNLVEAAPGLVLVIPAEELAYGTRYTARLWAQVADESGNLLDTNGDGLLWPDEPDLVWDFQTVDDGSTNSAPPTLAQAYFLPGNTEVRIEFVRSLVGGPAPMNSATFISQNIQMSDELGGIPLAFQAGTDPSAAHCLLQRSPVGPVTLFVSCFVADQYGNLFDGNNDGLGGTPGQDDWTGGL